MPASPKNILFIQPSLEGVGGIEKVVPTLASSLSATGDIVSSAVFYGTIPESQNFWHHRFTFSEAKTKNRFNRLFKVFRRLLFIKQSIKVANPDVVIVSAQGSALIVLFGKLLHLYNVPIVVYVHEGLGVSGKVYEFLIRKLYPVADGFLCVSKGIQEEVKKAIRTYDDKIVLAYNALPVGSTIEKTSFDFSSYSKPYFVTASRLEEIKGVEVLVDSFIEYAKKHSGTLFILGTGSLEADLKKRVSDASLSERIVFVGYSDNVLGFVKECDAYISCAKSESFGISLLESLATGVPIVVADVPYGPREVMDLPSSPNIYPYRTDFGFLLAPVNTKSRADWQQGFETALKQVTSTVYDEEIFMKRILDFSPEKQMVAVKQMVHRVTR